MKNGGKRAFPAMQRSVYMCASDSVGFCSGRSLASSTAIPSPPPRLSSPGGVSGVPWQFSVESVLCWHRPSFLLFCPAWAPFYELVRDCVDLGNSDAWPLALFPAVTDPVQPRPEFWLELFAVLWWPASFEPLQHPAPSPGRRARAVGAGSPGSITKHAETKDDGQWGGPSQEQVIEGRCWERQI